MALGLSDMRRPRMGHLGGLCSRYFGVDNIQGLGKMYLCWMLVNKFLHPVYHGKG